MKASEITAGGLYRAKVNNAVVVVRVDSIEEVHRSGFRSPSQGSLRYHVTNTKTGRRTVFRSAAKFRERVETIARVKAPPVPVMQIDPVVQPLTDAETIDEVPDAYKDQWRNLKATGGQHGPSPLDGAVESKATHVGDEQSPDPTPSAPTPQTPGTRSTPMTMTSPSAPTAGGTTTTAPATNGGIGAAVARQLEQRAAVASRTAPHLVIVARAGTGKTTTLVGGLERLMGGTPRDARGNPMTPSPQQAAVWDALCAGPRPRSVCFVAFNRAIAAELKARVPRGVDAKTMHGLGMYAVRKAFNLPSDDRTVNEHRVKEIVARLLGLELREVRKEQPVLLKAVDALVGLCKQNLIDGRDPAELTRLAHDFDVEMPGAVEAQALELVPMVLDACRDVAADMQVDYNDMIWLPVVCNIKVWQNDLLLVDEAQDLNRCQQALARKAGRRIVLCGDDRQAIYGFAGADAMSLPRMTEQLKATPEGCTVLPLTVTRRCGRRIVDEARTMVQDFSAHETNPEGEVSSARYTHERVRRGGETVTVPVPVERTYMPLVNDGDMILCRANSPLVTQCVMFLKQGRKARIRGRDVGASLLALVERTDAVTIPELVRGLADWLRAETDKELAQRNPSESKMQNLADRHDCVVALAEGARTVDEVKAKITALFSDEAGEGIILSSIHKAKGLEAGTVFYIDRFGPPMEKLKPWEREQELNLRYVAVTRAINKLVYVN